METVGPFVLLSMGFISVVAAVWLTVRNQPFKRTAPLWVFGVALGGVGVFGPGFLSDYSDFLKVVKMEKEGSSAAYGEFLTGVGAGKIDPGVARVGLSFLLNHPTPDLEKLISDRIPSGTAQGKKLLEGAKREIDTRRELGAKLARVPGVEKELAKGDQSGLGYFAESAFLENAPTRAVREIAEKRYRIVVPEGAGDAADAAMRVETLNALRDRQLRRIVTAPAAGGR